MDDIGSTSSYSGQQQRGQYENRLRNVPDSYLPTIAFLIQNLSKVKDSKYPAGSHAIRAEDMKMEESELLAGTVSTLLKVLKKAVNDRSMKKLELYLNTYIMTALRNYQPKSKQTNTKGAYYMEKDTLDKCDEYDDVILRIHEVMLLFQCPVPDDLENAFTDICDEKGIPETTFDGKTREFFVHAENKALRKMCDALSEEEVCQMYHNLRHKVQNGGYAQDDAFFAKESAKKLLELSVSTSDMNAIQGLKEASFYCFVLALFKEDFLSRIHTHTLAEYLQPEETKNISDPVTSVLRRYPLESNPPGLCIIFNMERDREGSRLDCEKIISLFRGIFKYDVIYKKDPTKHDVHKTIVNLDDDKFKFHDSLVVVFMSHGNKTYLTVADGKVHRRIDLIDHITAIGWLANKPKLFFIQACAKRRPKNVGQDDDDEDEESDAEGVAKVFNDIYSKKNALRDLHPFADTLVSYATKWYDTASRKKNKGSLYINTLVEQLETYGRKEPIQEVLQRVHYHVNMVKRKPKGEDKSRPRRQAPYFESSLQKVFIFPEN